MKSKKNYPKNQVKYSKALASTELFNHHDITNEQEKQLLLDNKIERLTNESFNLNGAYPYIIDLLNYVCTHHKDKIERQDRPQETHYRIAIPKAIFVDLILGEHKKQKPFLENEIYRLLSNKDENGDPIKPKVLPLNMTEAIRTKPIRLDIIYEDKKKLRPDQLALKNITGEKVKGYVIEFYKPLWSNLLDNEKGSAWFPLPSIFHAKMVHFIKKNKNNPVFKKFGQFGNSSNYRKLYLYLSLHDNSKSDEISYDAIDLTKKTLPSNIQKLKGNKYGLKNWFTTHQFLQKGIRLFYNMGEEGLLDGVKLIPTSVWYEKPMKNLRVKINRNANPLPPFENQVKYDDSGNAI